MFDKAYPLVRKFEGGYANDPDDSGGATNFGVTQKVYDKYRKSWYLPLQPVKSITEDEVRKIYEGYWRECGSDRIAKTHPRTAIAHFDFAFNAGFNQAAKTLQRSIGGLLVDGIIGPKTLNALLGTTDIDLADDYLDRRSEFYKMLTVKKPTQKKFLRSWLHRVLKIRRLIHDGTEFSIQSNAVPGSPV